MLVAEYERAVAARGAFSFAISGGSMLKMLSNLRADDRRVDWSKCTMGFVSHRCLPLDADGATTAKAKPAFLDAWTDAGLTVLNRGGTTDAEAEASAYDGLGRSLRDRRVLRAASWTPRSMASFDRRICRGASER